MDTGEARGRVNRARVARLGTLDPDGRLHLVPVCFALAGDTIYTAVDEKPKVTKELQRLRNIRAHPEVAILVDHYEEDWSKVWWVRIRGTARIIDPAEEEAQMALVALRDKYPQYRDEPPRGPVVAVRADGWRWWSAS